MEGIRKHLTTIIVAFVTATVAAGGTAAVAAVINAQKLDGYTANQLIRVGQQTVKTQTAQYFAGTMATVNIAAPHKGLLLITASTQIDDSAGIAQGTISCWVTLGGTKVVSSVRKVDFYPGTTGLYHEPCATMVTMPVAAGPHRVTFANDDPGGLATAMGPTNLTVIYEPFNGAGGLG